MEALMMDCNQDFRVGTQSRVPALRDFLRKLLDKPNGSEDIKKIILRVCDPRDYLDVPEKCQVVIDHLNKFLASDGYEIVLSENSPKLFRKGFTATVNEEITNKAKILDFDTVNKDIDRALKSVDSDPADALTAACSIVESVCRSILVELGLPIPHKKDIGSLMKAVQGPLNISPERSDLPHDIANDVKQVLGGLTSVAKGIGSLRTHAGDAHGRERGYPQIDSRTAKLAIHSANTLALFLIETWEKIFKKELHCDE